MGFYDFVERLRQWLMPKPEVEPAPDGQNHSTMARLAFLLTEDDPPSVG